MIKSIFQALAIDAPKKIFSIALRYGLDLLALMAWNYWPLWHGLIGPYGMESLLAHLA